MTTWLAFEEIEISHDGNTVRLRPSLRAAATLEQRFGIETIGKALAELDLTITSEIIRTASTSRREAKAFLCDLAGKPLSPFFANVQHSLVELVDMFVPTPDPKAKPSVGKGELITRAELYRNLYETATGALGWTPEQAWRATPTEINRAFDAHIEYRVRTGALTRGNDQQPDPDPQQAQRNVAAGLDPEFDRGGLEALRSSIKRHGR